MAHEVQQDVMGEMMSQRANAMHIVQDFLTETRERYTAWGCDPECTDRHTRSLDRLDGMRHCNCPASITVSGDTSIILGWIWNQVLKSWFVFKDLHEIYLDPNLLLSFLFTSSLYIKLNLYINIRIHIYHEQFKNKWKSDNSRTVNFIWNF